jgi:hypothetical protein
VGRAPWPAADPLVGLPERTKSRTRGSGADGGVRPTVLLCGAGAFACQPVFDSSSGSGGQMAEPSRDR